jgi:hypothetical protein
MIFFFSLVGCCIFYSIQNIKNWLSNEIVTEIKTIYEDLITFPAVTFCLDFVTKPRVLADIFRGCFFENEQNTCSLDNLEYFSYYDASDGMYYNCYKFNAAGMSVQALGYKSGLNIDFNSSIDDTIWFFIGDNKVHLTPPEVNNACELYEKHGKYVGVPIKKTVDIKLPFPYSNCSDQINSETSHLVKRILQQNITYRQKNCYQMCHDDYLNEYSVSRNLTVREAYVELSFDYKSNCSEKCPLECTSTYFDVQQIESSSATEFLSVNIFYTERQYTLITQTPKTTVADLISNTGGVLGLFLDISFYHAYKLFIFIRDFIIII